MIHQLFNHAGVVIGLKYILYLLQKVQRRSLSRGSTFYRNNLVTSRGIMSAILLMSGPACTREAMNSNGPKMLRHITSSQFTTAATKLQEEGLGTVFALQGRHSSQSIFIKKPPSQISEGLMRNQDLCLVQEYITRYNMRPPASIIRKWKYKLVALGLVPEDHFKE